MTAAVADDIPGDWDARRIEITMRDDDSGRVSMVEQGNDRTTNPPTPSDERPHPRTHLAGLTGMDLVRRTLEEARGAARSQGKDVGRGRNSPHRDASRAGGAHGRGPDPTPGTRRRWAR